MNFSKLLKGVVSGETRVLLCNLGAAVHEGFEEDCAVYKRYYRTVDALSVRRENELIAALQSGYDIVHLFSRCSGNGTLSDLEDAQLDGTNLIRLCCEYRIKLLWIAAANASPCYVNGFRTLGRQLNLVMTLNRKGDQFSDFLDKLLSRIASGEALPPAWAALAPQTGVSPKSELPDCIFFAGLNVKLAR